MRSSLGKMFFVHRDIEMLKAFYPRSGFSERLYFQGCNAARGQFDFLVGLVSKALHACVRRIPRSAVQLGEIVGWRNLFWSLTDAMAGAPDKWVGDSYLPSIKACLSYRIFATESLPRNPVHHQQIVASGLIYLPSSSLDFKSPESTGISRVMRVDRTASTTKSASRS